METNKTEQIIYHKGEIFIVDKDIDANTGLYFNVYSVIIFLGS